MRWGTAVSEGDLGKFISEPKKFATALVYMEKFSLIKWSRNNGMLSIHRIVQNILRSKLIGQSRVSCMSSVVEMCDGVKATQPSPTLRRRCRRQIVEPLLLVTELRTYRPVDVLLRAGMEMEEDGELI